MKKRKVTFLWLVVKRQFGPPLPPSPIFLSHIKFLNAHNYDVNAIDAFEITKDADFFDIFGNSNLSNKSIDIITSTINKERPDILICESPPSCEDLIFLIEFLKNYEEKNKESKIILIGRYITISPEEFLKLLPEGVILLKNNDEYRLLKLVEKISTNNNWKKSEGIAFREKDTVFKTKIVNSYRNLDELPFYDFEDFVNFKLENYGKMISVFLSRSCIFNCKFCADNSIHGVYREHGPMWFIGQIKHLNSLYELNRIDLRDNSFFINSHKTKQILRMICKEKFDFSFEAFSRINQLSTEILLYLKKSKFRDLFFGIENVSPKVLKWYNKGMDNIDYPYAHFVEKMAKKINKFDIQPTLSFIFGAPIETKNDMEKNIKFIEKMYRNGCRIEFSHLRAIPGTKIWSIYLQKKLSLFKISDYLNQLNNCSDSFKKTSEISELFTIKKYLNLPSLTFRFYAIQNYGYTNIELTSLLNEAFTKIEKIGNYG